MPTSDVAPEPQGLPALSPRSSRSIWSTPRALGLHVTLVLVVPTFLALFWWQVDRVRQGNTLSWAYVFEWPFFTAYAIYLWWKLVHDQPDATAAFTAPATSPSGASCTSVPGAAQETGGAEGSAPRDGAEDGGVEEIEGEDEELAAYNRYLAELHASGRRKRW